MEDSTNINHIQSVNMTLLRVYELRIIIQAP